MNYLFLILFLATSSLYAGETMKCRDRGNFMSSWYELWIERDLSQIKGTLIFQTAEGPKKLQNFKVALMRGTTSSLVYSGGGTRLLVDKKSSSDFVEFYSNIGVRPFSESFKCPKGTGKVTRSSWGTSSSQRLFESLNVPIVENNGGFREVRQAKFFNGAFSLAVREVGSNVYSYIFKAYEYNGKPFGIEESLKIKKAFKYLLDSTGRYQLPEINLKLTCQKHCVLVL